MRITIDYTDETRDALIAEQEALGFTLVEDQRHFDGNHLIFADGKPEPVRDLAAELDEINAKIADYDDLKAKVETLEKK